MGALFDRSIHPLYTVMAFVSAAIVLLLLISGTNNRKEEIKKNHKLIFIWVIFFCLQDGVWGLFASHIFYNDAGLFFMSNIFHLSAIFSAFAWTAYFLSRIKEETRHAKLNLSFAGIVALIQFGMVAVNLSSRFMFYVDEHGWYQTTDYRAIMFYLQFVTYILIGIVSFIGTARQQKNSKKGLSAIFFVNLSPLLFSIFQMIYPDAPADSIGFAIGCVIIKLFLSREYDEQVFTLEQTQEQLKESLAFTDFFLDQYISAYYVDLKDGSYKVYRRTEELEREYPIVDNYFSSLKDYINKAVHPDDRAGLTAIMEPHNLKEKLKASPSFTHIFKEISSESERVYKVQVIRGADEDHMAFGFFDMTEEYQEQQKRLLGAIPLSPDVLAKANIGLWSFELDEGCAPRMYVDDAMLKLIGLDHQISPEKTYHAWYDNIDDGSYDLVADAVAKMTSGEHAEVQYPWHHPNGDTWIVRCGGVRNPEYTKGIRIEGTHQNVTALIHFDEKERARAKKLESELAIEKIRTEALSFIADHEPDMEEALDFFGEQILRFTGCDQVIFHELNGKRILRNAPGIVDLPQAVCSRCPVTDPNSAVFGESDILCINDCSEGYRGTTVHTDCPVKSAYMQRIYSGGELTGLFSVHYINEQHTFSEDDIDILKMVAVCLGLMIGRVKEKQDEIARIEAESSSKAKTEFLFNMSHDIRTPMNAILGYTDIAMNHIEEQQRVRDSLNKIRVSSNHLLKLINDILEMSRIEAGKMEIVREPLNVKEASDGIINMSQVLADQKEIKFKAIVGDLANPYIYADELHTKQVLINIISNAIKYTNPCGTVLYQIEQLGSPEGGIAWYRFTVTDNGIGMSDEFQKHIFESFSREQSATVSKLEGTGLGLSIVKKIVDKIGGTITVQSKLGEGSTFVVEIPFEVLDDKAVEAFIASQSEEEILLDATSFKGLKALLVEDNEMNREIAIEILEEVGLVIDTAEDGAIAVRMVSEKGTGYYDFILMDIQMPVMNGYEATAKIRELPGGSEIPIIALSANAFNEDVERSLAAGMNAHAVKPIDVRSLFETIQRLVK